MTQPDNALYTRFQNSLRLEEAKTLRTGSRLSHTSDNDSRLKHLTKEEKQEKVQDFTQSILRRHGTVGGSKSLFVSSKQAFYTTAG